mgnify:CR=1 FL=1
MLESLEEATDGLRDLLVDDVPDGCTAHLDKSTAHLKTIMAYALAIGNFLNEGAFLFYKTYD